MRFKLTPCLRLPDGLGQWKALVGDRVGKKKGDRSNTQALLGSGHFNSWEQRYLPLHSGYENTPTGTAGGRLPVAGSSALSWTYGPGLASSPGGGYRTSRSHWRHGV